MASRRAVNSPKPLRFAAWSAANVSAVRAEHSALTRLAATGRCTRDEIGDHGSRCTSPASPTTPSTTTAKREVQEGRCSKGVDRCDGSVEQSQVPCRGDPAAHHGEHGPSGGLKAALPRYSRMKFWQTR